jgi:hypothetical protein
MDLGADGFVGSPLVDSSSRCMGPICAINLQPLAHPTEEELVLGRAVEIRPRTS